MLKPRRTAGSTSLSRRCRQLGWSSPLNALKYGGKQPSERAVPACGSSCGGGSGGGTAADVSNLAAPADAPGVAEQLEGGRGDLARLSAAGTEAAAQGGQQEGASSLHGEGLC